MPRTSHVPGCDRPGMPADRCRVCSYIEFGYQQAILDIDIRVRSMHPHPTLGVQKIMRLLEELVPHA